MPLHAVSKSVPGFFGRSTDEGQSLVLTITLAGPSLILTLADHATPDVTLECCTVDAASEVGLLLASITRRGFARPDADAPARSASGYSRKSPGTSLAEPS